MVTYITNESKDNRFNTHHFKRRFNSLLANVNDSDQVTIQDGPLHDLLLPASPDLGRSPEHGEQVVQGLLIVHGDRDQYQQLQSLVREPAGPVL